MKRVLLAEAAMLLHFKSVGIVLLVLHRIVISLLALAACKGDSFSHDILRMFSVENGLFSLCLVTFSGCDSIKKDPERFNYYNKAHPVCQYLFEKKIGKISLFL